MAWRAVREDEAALRIFFIAERSWMSRRSSEWTTALKSGPSSRGAEEVAAAGGARGGAVGWTEMVGSALLDWDWAKRGVAGVGGASGLNMLIATVSLDARPRGRLATSLGGGVTSAAVVAKAVKIGVGERGGGERGEGGSANNRGSEVEIGGGRGDRPRLV